MSAVPCAQPRASPASVRFITFYLSHSFYLHVKHRHVTCRHLSPGFSKSLFDTGTRSSTAPPVRSPECTLNYLSRFQHNLISSLCKTPVSCPLWVFHSHESYFRLLSAPCFLLPLSVLHGRPLTRRPVKYVISNCYILGT